MPKRLPKIGHASSFSTGEVSICDMYRPGILERRLNCPQREERVFAGLSPEASEELSAITLVNTFPKGAQLFGEHEAARGVFIILSGRVNLSVSSGQGMVSNFGLQGPGDMLGLIATVSGKPYHAVGELLEPSEIKFIPRAQFLRFLAKYGQVALRVAEELSEAYYQALSEVHRTGFSRTAAGRFARFLLQCPSESDEADDELRLKLSMTHRAIGRAIGVRRETLSRIFSEFKKKKLLHVRGETIIIPSRAALELIAGS